jgi:hypothetical protein
MPVVTRNQLRNKMMNINNTNIPPKLILPQLAGLYQFPDIEPEETPTPEATPKVRIDTPKPQVNNGTLKTWFVNYIKKMLTDIDNLHDKKRDIRKSFDNGDNTTKKVELRNTSFEIIRYVIEMFANITAYLPELIGICPTFHKFACGVYTKIRELYTQLYDLEDVCKPVTDEEHQLIKILVHTLDAAEKMVIPYVSSECSIKRKRTPVDYTGMDTIEPECDSDAIAALWYLVDSIWYDSDYETEDEEEDDDDDEVDVYLVDEVESIIGEEPEEDDHDYGEDEDYIPEE